MKNLKNKLAAFFSLKGFNNYNFSLLVVIVLTTSCKNSSWHYSPLDSYVNATIQRSADSTKAANEAKQFIDSINTRHEHRMNGFCCIKTK